MLTAACNPLSGLVAAQRYLPRLLRHPPGLLGAGLPLRALPWLCHLLRSHLPSAPRPAQGGRQPTLRGRRTIAARARLPRGWRHLEAERREGRREGRGGGAVCAALAAAGLRRVQPLHAWVAPRDVPPTPRGDGRARRGASCMRCRMQCMQCMQCMHCEHTTHHTSHPALTARHRCAGVARAVPALQHLPPCGPGHLPHRARPHAHAPRPRARDRWG